MTFKSAFAAARKAGKKEFSWNGKRYSTKLREDKAPSKSPTPAKKKTASSPTPKKKPTNKTTSSPTPKKKPAGSGMKSPLKPHNNHDMNEEKRQGMRNRNAIRRQKRAAKRK